MALPTATYLTVRSCQLKTIDLPVIAAFGLPNLATYCCGVLFLVHVLAKSPPVVLRHALGVFFLVFAATRIVIDCGLLPQCTQRAEARPPGTRSRYLFLGWTVTGILSGTLSGVFGIGGPPTMVFMTLARLDKGAMRSTNQAVNIALQLTRIVMLLYTKVLNLAAPGIIVEIVCLVMCGISGAMIGDWLHGAVSTLLVVRIILLLLLMGSASLIIDLKSGSVLADVTVCVMASVAIGGLVALVTRQFVRTCREGHSGWNSNAHYPSARQIPYGARLCDECLFPLIGREREIRRNSSLEFLSDFGADQSGQP